MESCALSDPWDDGLSASSKSLWAAQVASMMKRDSSAASPADDKMEVSHADHRILEKLITQQLAACSSTWQAANPISSSDIVKEVAVSNRNELCAPSREFERKQRVGALRRIDVVKDGTSNCKRLYSSVAMSSSAANVAAAATRVRARRGEATDQHSISERTRRTKITERMRALHRLIPDASKTNKASMLDEVIQHVSMLQARLKMECMRKPDARSDTTATATTICGPQNAPADKEGWRRSYVNRMIERVLDPLEDRLAEAERQVMTALSHPSSTDLSLTSNYLASAGLTLLPISQLSSLLPKPNPISSAPASSITCTPTPLSR